MFKNNKKAKIMLPIRRVGITWNGIVVSFFERYVSSRQSVLHLQGRQHGPLSLVEYSIYNCYGSSHLTLYYGVPVSSTSCNLCPKSITRSNFHLSVCEQLVLRSLLLFRARNDSREKVCTRDILPMYAPQKIYTYIRISGKT